MARFNNSDQTTVQLIQIKSNLQFDRQIKLKSFSTFVDQISWPHFDLRSRKHGLWLVEENDGKGSVRSSTDQFMQFCSSVPIQYRIIITYQCTYTHQYHEKSDIMN